MANIILVEDNVIFRELLRELCEMEGHEVSEYSRAEDALVVLRNVHEFIMHKQHIDLIITDFNMDGKNGFEFVQEIRSIEAVRDVPIIMISSTSKDMRDLLRLENVAFLQKPCPNSSLIVTIRNMLHGVADKPAATVDPRLMTAVFSAAPTKSHQLPTAKRLGFAPPTPPAAPAAPTAASMPPAPPTSMPPAAKMLSNSPAAPSRVPELKRIDSGLKSVISRDHELTEFLITRQKAAEAPAGAGVSGSSPVADLVNKILDGAIARGASDIHIEPQGTTVDVRARVDGALQELVTLPVNVADNLSARIKVLSRLDITEKRLPQDGQFSRKSAEGVESKFRVSTLPAVHGEKIVIRILPTQSRAPKLDSIGLTDEEASVLRAVLRSPNGVVLATGPTGSGKTTTLYSLLDSLNTRERNIVTVEDPVECQLPGITQVQVNAGIGYTFERVMRSFLRQDPNVMLVGEIRDEETAQIALKAAVTGHLVLSSLHTNDAVGAIHRLLSMGLPAYLVAAATRVVIAQRLVRRLCLKCRQAGALTPDEATFLTAEEKAALPQVWRAKGCAECHGSGYAGRKAVYEILAVNTHDMKAAIARSASPEELKEIAKREGLVGLREKALRCVAEGATSIEEALAVLFV